MKPPFGRIFLELFPSALNMQIQVIWKVVNSGDSWMYPYQRTPMGNPYM